MRSTPKEDAGYIYVKGWSKFQHPDAMRRAGPGLAWIKNYTGLLDNDAYLDLAPTYRAVLHMIWILTARSGQGRCSARADHLQRACNLPAGWAQKSLDALSDAGFIEVRASKARAARKPRREGSKEPQKRREGARETRRQNLPINGREPDHSEETPLTREEGRDEARTVLTHLKTRSLKALS